jgi:sugar phosphate permease
LRESVGTLGGILNFCNQLAGIGAAIITGYVRQWTNSYSRAFLVAAIFLVIGICGYVFLLGRIEPIPEPD